MLQGDIAPQANGGGKLALVVLVEFGKSGCAIQFSLGKKKIMFIFRKFFLLGPCCDFNLMPFC